MDRAQEIIAEIQEIRRQAGELEELQDQLLAELLTIIQDTAREEEYRNEQELEEREQRDLLRIIREANSETDTSEERWQNRFASESDTSPVASKSDTSPVAAVRVRQRSSNANRQLSYSPTRNTQQTASRAISRQNTAPTPGVSRVARAPARATPVRRSSRIQKKRRR